MTGKDNETLETMFYIYKTVQWKNPWHKWLIFHFIFRISYFVLHVSCFISCHLLMGMCIADRPCYSLCDSPTTLEWPGGERVTCLTPEYPKEIVKKKAVLLEPREATKWY